MTTAQNLIKPEKVYTSFGSAIGTDSAEEYLASSTRLVDSAQRPTTYNQHSIDDILGNRRGEDLDRGMWVVFMGVDIALFPVFCLN